MQSVTSRIWTRVAVSISYDDNDYTTGTSIKTQKMVLDAALLNTLHYKVRIKGKVEQSRERSSALPYIAIEKGVFGSLSTNVANLF